MSDRPTSALGFFSFRLFSLQVYEHFLRKFFGNPVHKEGKQDESTGKIFWGTGI